MKRFKTVDEYIDSNEQWRDELVTLRKILNTTELKETVKWGAPCYTIDGKNLVGLGAFKSFFTLWFFQDALLKDEKKVLINAQGRQDQSAPPVAFRIRQRDRRQADQVLRQGSNHNPAPRQTDQA